MSSLPKQSGYPAFLNSISDIYVQAQAEARRAVNHVLVQAYWEIGRQIVTVEQNQAVRAKYGDRLLERLANDLTEKHGKGFSVRNLLNMRQFYLSYKRIPQAPAELSWTHYQILSTIEDPQARARYEGQSVRNSWSSRELTLRLRQDEVRCLTLNGPAANALPVPAESWKLSARRGKLYTARVKISPEVTPPAGHLIIDFGFDVWRAVPSSSRDVKNKQAVELRVASGGIKAVTGTRTARDLYCYKAAVERVVDGDTLVVIIDLGPGVWIRQRLRLNGLDAPELSSKAGLKAKAFLEDILRDMPFIIVQTSQIDMYHRYLADVFYLPGENTPAVVAARGRFLNQDLLDAGVVRGG